MHACAGQHLAVANSWPVRFPASPSHVYALSRGEPSSASLPMLTTPSNPARTLSAHRSQQLCAACTALSLSCCCSHSYMDIFISHSSCRRLYYTSQPAHSVQLPGASPRLPHQALLSDARRQSARAHTATLAPAFAVYNPMHKFLALSGDRRIGAAS